MSDFVRALRELGTAPNVVDESVRKRWCLDAADALEPCQVESEVRRKDAIRYRKALKEIAECEMGFEGQVARKALENNDE